MTVHDPNPPPHAPAEPGCPLRRTRLAPSPTGALHLGNARTFLITWAMARRRGWRIMLRIEDLDGPRIKPGAAEGIVDTLAWLGMDWDEGPMVQSVDLAPYQEAMRRLANQGFAYPCRLSRTEIEAAASAPQEGSHEVRYPASLRPAPSCFPFPFEETAAPPAGGAAGGGGSGGEASWRLVVPDGAVEFVDACAGPQRITVSESIGDFVIWTRRAQPAYQLAVVVDDFRQAVTDVIRGDDLLDSAARQILLYRALGYAQRNSPGAVPLPDYCHLPLVIGPDGKRLAKRHGDTRVETYRSLGVPAEAVIGLIASWSFGSGEPGMPPPPRRPMSAREFSERFSLTTMSTQPIRFTQEDDQWLRSQAP